MTNKKGYGAISNKTFTHEEILPANSLRTLSQKDIMELLNRFGKIGFITNNRPEMTLLKWERYDEMVQTIEQLNQKVEELENQLDDMFLSEVYWESVAEAELKGEERYRVPKDEEAIDHMEKKRTKRK